VRTDWRANKKARLGGRATVLQFNHALVSATRRAQLKETKHEDRYE